MVVVVFPMFSRGDDALRRRPPCRRRSRVARVLICTPDKDLAQCVIGDRIVQFDRRAREVRDEAGVIKKFGVPPASIPDYLALVGDSADGFPGLPGWGAKSAAAVLARYGHIDQVPDRASQWDVSVRSASALAATLAARREQAALFRTLATLRLDAPTVAGIDELRWSGPAPEFESIAAWLGQTSLFTRAQALAARLPRT